MHNQVISIVVFMSFFFPGIALRSEQEIFGFSEVLGF